MQYHAPSRCPVCGQTMEVTRRSHCETELAGNFTPCRFACSSKSICSLSGVFAVQRLD
ncbi:MAG: DUF2089-like zinc ribbon domain-containing protein [Oscillospiraceae bacterium]